MLLIAREMECVNWHLLSDIFSPLELGWSQLLQNPMTPYLSIGTIWEGFEGKDAGDTASNIRFTELFFMFPKA